MSAGSLFRFLAALGGAYSLVTNFASETVIRYITTQSDLAFNAYMAVLAVVSLIQIVMYIYIGASKKWKQYFAACLRVNGMKMQCKTAFLPVKAETLFF